jgi:hypothetical protein
MDSEPLSLLGIETPFDLKFGLNTDSVDSFDDLELLLPENLKNGDSSSPLSSLPASPPHNELEEPLWKSSSNPGFAPTVVPPVAIKIEQVDDFPMLPHDVKPISRASEPTKESTETISNSKRTTRRKRSRTEQEDSDSSVSSPVKHMKPSSPSSPQDIKPNLPHGPTLTEEEERKLKRQKRLLKNRESAQLSRQRKKQYVEELEKKLETLTTSNDSLNEQVNHLSSDKQRLEEEVLFLRNLIKSSPTMAPAEKTQVLSTKNAKAAGVCLLIMLFSFGLVSKTLDPLAVEENSSYSREEIPEVLPAKFQTGRVLQSLQVSEPVVDRNSLKHLIPELSMPNPDQNSRRKVKISSSDDRVNSDMKESNIMVFCPSAHQLSTPKIDGNQVSLVIPANAYNSTDFNGTQLASPQSESGYLEIKCNVASLKPFNGTKI